MATSTESDLSTCICRNFPRSEHYYETSIVAIGNLIQYSSLEEVIRIILSMISSNECNILPKHLGNISEDFSFQSFIKRLRTNYVRKIDFAVSTFIFSIFKCFHILTIVIQYYVIHLFISDCIAYLMNFYDGINIQPLVVQKLVEFAFFFQNAPDVKFAPHSEFMISVWEKVSAQWISILSASMAYGYF